MKNKLKNIPNIFFLIGLILIFSLCIIKFILNRNEYNYIDNRMSYKFKFPTLYEFSNGIYQENLDNAIADQLPKYEFFKLSYNRLTIKWNYNVLKFLHINSPSRYIKIRDINIYNDYLLYTPYSSDFFYNSSKDDINYINELKKNTKANVYMYFIDSDFLHKYSTNYNVDYKNYLDDSLKIDGIGYLDVSNFDEYKKYFYKTDHHWNNVGSYKGYTDIAQLLNLKNILKPEDEICSDLMFYGSKTKNLADISFTQDKACIYKFNYPKFTFYEGYEKIDGYGIDLDKISDEPHLTYAILYGNDIGELKILNNDAKNKKRLLIYSNSYSNAINKLLASHYYKTYIIDGRHYNSKNMIDYIKEKGIDDVLILSNAMLFADDIKW